MTHSIITVRQNTENLIAESASFEERLKSKCLDTSDTSTTN